MYKLYQTDATHALGNACQVMADLAGVTLEVICPSEEVKASKEFMAKRGHGKFPMLETPEGDVVFESAAICMFLASHNGGEYLAKSPMEAARVDEWMCVGTSSLVQQLVHVIYSTFGHVDASKYDSALVECKKIFQTLEDTLAKNEWLAGKTMTVADVFIWMLVQMCFAMSFDAEYRKTVPHLTAWATKISSNPNVVRRFGHVKMC